MYRKSMDLRAPSPIFKGDFFGSTLLLVVAHIVSISLLLTNWNSIANLWLWTSIQYLVVGHAPVLLFIGIWQTISSANNWAFAEDEAWRTLFRRRTFLGLKLFGLFLAGALVCTYIKPHLPFGPWLHEAVQMIYFICVIAQSWKYQSIIWRYYSIKY